MEKEVSFRLIKHITFLENEMKDYGGFECLSWDEYNRDRSKRRDVERWVENIINSVIDIAKIILASEGIPIPDTYKAMVKSLSLLSGFDKENVEKISGWVPLRNVISHEYLDIRWQSIRRFISETKILCERFLGDTRQYLDKKKREEAEVPKNPNDGE